jgi:LAGLIDADG endonuclease
LKFPEGAKTLKALRRSFDAIISTVIPFFNQRPTAMPRASPSAISSFPPLRRRGYFLDFVEVAHMIQAKEHLTQEGLDKIRMIKANMNSKRSFSDKENFMNSIKGSIKLTAGWISGFIDAEGYFGIYVSNASKRRCELKLSIAQNAHDLVLLEAIAIYFNVSTKIVDNLGKGSSVKRIDIYKFPEGAKTLKALRRCTF